MTSPQINTNAKTKNPNRLWEMSQVKDFVKQAKSRVGDRGWDFLSRQMQEGLIAQQFAYVLIGNARHDLPGAAIQTLYADMLQAAGLNDET